MVVWETFLCYIFVNRSFIFWSQVKSIKVMSIKQLSNHELPKVIPDNGRIIYDYQIGCLEGKLLTFVESMGFSESREKAVKDILKSILRESLYLECGLIMGNYLIEVIE